MLASHTVAVWRCRQKDPKAGRGNIMSDLPSFEKHQISIARRRPLAGRTGLDHEEVRDPIRTHSRLDILVDFSRNLKRRTSADLREL